MNQPNIEHSLIFKPEQAEEQNKYEGLFKMIHNTNILPHGSEWLVDNLEKKLNQVYVDYGKAAMDSNGEGKVYLALSGGLDSSLAVALLHHNLPEARIITFTMGGTTNHPDIQHAKLVANQFNTEHHEIIPKPEEIEATMLEYRSIHPEVDLERATKTGDVDVHLLLKIMAKMGAKTILATDGIDELMGGYWDHRKDGSDIDRQERYKHFWNRLVPDHLAPLVSTADHFEIDVLFPYLDPKIVETISEIPLLERSSIDKSKKPLRHIAEKLDMPTEILTRPKRGQVGMLDLR